MPWCGLCGLEVVEDALRCATCGAAFDGPQAHLRSENPPVSYGNSPASENELGLELSGIALGFGYLPGDDRST